MKIAQLFLSCLHGWGLDPDLDKLCLSKLGLIRPKQPLSFGLVSRGGHMALLMPGWHNKYYPQLPVCVHYTMGYFLILGLFS